MMIWVWFPIVIHDDEPEDEKLAPMTNKQAMVFIVSLLSLVVVFVRFLVWVCS
jgi:flagellar biogenesis protein FliO